MRILVATTGSFKRHCFTFYSERLGVLLQSRAYLKRANLNIGLRAVKKNISDPKKYVLKEGNFYLRANNNREIGRSPDMTPEQMKEAMALLQKYGRDAPLVEVEQVDRQVNPTKAGEK